MKSEEISGKINTIKFFIEDYRENLNKLNALPADTDVAIKTSISSRVNEARYYISEALKEIIFDCMDDGDRVGLVKHFEKYINLL